VPAQNPGPPQTAADVRSTQPAVQDVELDTKVRADAVRSAQNAEKQSAGLQKAVVAGIVGRQLIDSCKEVPPLDEPLVQAAINAAPIAFLTSTADSPWEDKRLWGLVAVAAIVLAKQSGLCIKGSQLRTTLRTAPGEQMLIGLFVKGEINEQQYRERLAVLRSA
jgi:hypothetical protein